VQREGQHGIGPQTKEAKLGRPSAGNSSTPEQGEQGTEDTASMGRCYTLCTYTLSVAPLVVTTCCRFKASILVQEAEVAAVCADQVAGHQTVEQLFSNSWSNCSNARSDSLETRRPERRQSTASLATLNLRRNPLLLWTLQQEAKLEQPAKNSRNRLSLSLFAVSLSQKRKMSAARGAPWSPAEIEAFFQGHLQHGPVWETVAQLVGTRSAEQCEALFSLNKTYLSLPAAVKSVQGLAAMMTDHFNSLVSAGPPKGTVSGGRDDPSQWSCSFSQGTVFLNPACSMGSFGKPVPFLCAA
jgi:hypothetical protein